MQLAVHALPSMNPDEEIWAKTGHPFAPTSLAMAVGDEQSTWEDYGMRWDNSGKNAHYAPINWSNVNVCTPDSTRQKETLHGYR